MMEAFCKTCGGNQEVERCEDESSNQVYCLACGDEFEYVEKGASSGGAIASDDKYANYKVGLIMRVEPVAKSKDLKLCHIDLIGDGNDDTLVPVVTNAKYVEAGWKVVVACIGAIVPAGATLGANGSEDDEVLQVTKRNVQGVESRGMICDCFMLGWTGGAKGFIQRVPDSSNVGDAPPDSRPRM